MKNSTSASYTSSSKLALLFHVLIALGVITQPVFAQQTTISLGSSSSSPGGSAAINLTLTTSGGVQPAGIQWTMNYPAADISSVNVVAGASATAAGKSVTCSSSSGSTMCILFGLNSNVVGSGVAATATFNISGATKDSLATIQIAGVMASDANGTVIPSSGTGGAISIAQPVAPTLSGISCTQSNVNAPGSASCSVTLSGPALTGGSLVTLSSNNAGITVPANVLVSAGQSSASFTANVGSISSNQTAIVTATLSGTSKTFTLTATALAQISTLSCSPSTLGSNASSTCTIALNKAATIASPVAISSSSAALTVPASISIAAGQSGASFLATTATVIAAQSVMVAGSLNGGTLSTSVSLASPVQTSSLSCAPATVTAPASATCTVTLSAPAPAGGVSVTLSSNNASFTTLPVVAIGAGQTSTAFFATVSAISSNQSALLTAALNGSSKTFTLAATASTISTQPADTHALNPLVSALDQQWLGSKYASDGNVYFASSTVSAHHGAAFFKYNPATKVVTTLSDDITKICGENPQTNPQGAVRSDIVEASGWLYFSTHFENDTVPGTYNSYTGSHVIGYQLSTGVFHDFGVTLANYTSYSGMTVDPVRNFIYVFVTGELPGQASYMFRINSLTGAKANLGQVGSAYASCFNLFIDQRGDVWFSVENGSGSLQRIHGDTGLIDYYANVLPQLYLWNQPVPDPNANNQSQRHIRWMQALDGNRAVFTLGNNGGMLYIFDSTKAIGSGQEYTAVQHIGYTNLGLAVGNNRVFYSQRANRGCADQGDGMPTAVCGAAPVGGVKDFHLLSVSLDSTTNYAISDYGLMQDASGRQLWRAQSMSTDGNNRVFTVGDWYTIAGDAGSLYYTYNTTTGAESNTQLNRGEFLAVTDVGPLPISVTPASITLGPNQTQQFTAAAVDPKDTPVIWSVSGGGVVSTSGFYTAPSAISSNLTVTVTATSPVNSARIATATVNLKAPVSTAAATYVSLDQTTKGSWKATYGADGFQLAGDMTSLPSYAQVAFTGPSSYVWSASTQDARGLQKGASSATDRIAATWYNSSFVIDANVLSGTHRVALYALDWDANQRAERIDVLDAVTGTVLDSRTASGFSNGSYLVWNITGHVQFKVTLTSGPNAVMSGILFGGGQVVAPPTIAQNPVSVSVAAAQTATFTVAASAGSGLTYQWQSQASGASAFANITGATAASYTTAALTVSNSGTQFRCIVANPGGSVTSTAATVTVTPANVASFVGLDTTTKGSWKGVYGSDGFMLAGDMTSLPSYAQVSFTGQTSYVWSSSTQDVRGMQKGSSSATDRIAGTWYGSSFVADVNVSSGAHRVAFYALDWDGGQRVERIDVLDPTTGAVLDSRTVSGFSAGTYLVWHVTGHVQFKVTLIGGPNAVVSGMLFGG